MVYIDKGWQDLIPGSDVHKPKDNIELTTMLISRIAKRLDDPSIENIYSLYNSLSHDRTYVNKEGKTTPYFAKMAMEARAWEKDNWSSPGFPSAKDARREVLPSDRHDLFDNRFGRWGSSPAGIAAPPASDGSASFDHRFGTWSTVPAGGLGDTRSPVLRELEKYRRAAAPDGPTPTSVQGAPTPAFQPDAVYSPAGDFFENFPRGSVDAATRSPVSFRVSGPGFGPRVTDNFGATGNGPLGVLGGFIGNSPMDPAEARPQLRGVSAANFSSEETNYIDPSENALGGPRPATNPRLRRVSSAFPGFTSHDLEQPVTQPEPAPLLGIFSGKPILPLPHEVWGLPDRSSASPNGALFDFLAGLARRNPAALPPDDDPRGFDRNDQAQAWFIQRQR